MPLWAVGGILNEWKRITWFVQWPIAIILNRTDTSHLFFFTGSSPLQALSLHRDPKLQHGYLSPESARYVKLCVSYSMQRFLRKKIELGKLSLYPRGILLWWYGNGLTGVLTLGPFQMDGFQNVDHTVTDGLVKSSCGLRRVCVLRFAFFFEPRVMKSCSGLWLVGLVLLASPSWVCERGGCIFLGGIMVCYCINPLRLFRDQDEFSLVRRTLWDSILIISKAVLLHCFKEALFTHHWSLSPPVVIFKFATVRWTLHVSCLNRFSHSPGWRTASHITNFTLWGVVLRSSIVRGQERGNHLGVISFYCSKSIIFIILRSHLQVPRNSVAVTHPILPYPQYDPWWPA